MKAITASNINKNITAREVIYMNLISSIMIKENSKSTAVDNKRSNMSQDRGLSLYRALEFSRDSINKPNHNLQMERICSRLV